MFRKRPTGLEALAEGHSEKRAKPASRYPPNWECLGKRAENLRNDFMLADSRPDFVIAFPGGRNTTDLVAKVSAAGLPVVHAAGKTKADCLRRVGVSGDAETTRLVSSW